MRRFFLTCCLALTPFAALADGIEGTDWQLVAIDGQAVDAAVSASLGIGLDGAVSGKAPCNRFTAQNMGTLPEVRLGPIAATRMACDRMAEERAFFATLAVIDLAKLAGEQYLILTGPEGRSVEFVRDRRLDTTVCSTCPPSE